MDSLSPLHRASPGVSPPAGSEPASGQSAQPHQALGTRVATGVWGILAVVLFIYLGNPWLLLGLSVLIVVGLLEFYRMMDRVGYRPVREAGMGAGVLFAVAAATPRAPAWAPFVLPALLIYTAVAQFRGARPGRWVMNTAVTVLGSLYVGYLFAYVERLRGLALSPGRSPGMDPMPAFLVFAVVWAADTAAYFAGLAFGNHKLLPQVSPHKSVEGAVAAVLIGIAAGGVFGWAAGMNLSMSLAVGGLCAAAAICGDLWESAIKREAGVKDAGYALPGHGGILDRFDGLLFAAIIGYAVMVWWPRP